MNDPIIKVVSKSFSSHPVLRAELLESFPKTVFNEDSLTYDEEGLIQHFQDPDGVVVGLEMITEPLLSACPNLKIIAKYGVGLDNIDLTACRNHEVHVGWTGGSNKRGVAEMTLCFMLGLSRHIFFASRSLAISNDWSKVGGVDLSGRIIGIIGVGHIGKEVVSLLKPFGCKVLVNDILDQSVYYQKQGVTEVDKEEIYAMSDIITIHTPLNKETKHLINADVFSQMKKSAHLINVARGGVVDQQALKQALMHKKITGAAVDVFDVEPCNDQQFLDLPNLYCTPHTGGSSEESILAMGRSAIHHLIDYFK